VQNLVLKGLVSKGTYRRKTKQTC